MEVSKLTGHALCKHAVPAPAGWCAISRGLVVSLATVAGACGTMVSVEMHVGPYRGAVIELRVD